jgi:hypothetical protein
MAGSQRSMASATLPVKTTRGLAACGCSVLRTGRRIRRCAEEPPAVYAAPDSTAARPTSRRNTFDGHSMRITPA